MNTLLGSVRRHFTYEVDSPDDLPNAVEQVKQALAKVGLAKTCTAELVEESIQVVTEASDIADF